MNSEVVSAAARGEFDEFVKAKDWKRLARTIMRRFKQPFWVDQEDVVQDLLLAALQHFKSYDPSRGVPLARYIIWNAIDRAKKKAHQARLGKRLHRGDDFAPSQVEVPVDATDCGPLFGIAEADQEQRLHRMEVVRCIGKWAKSSSERVVARAVEFSAGDLQCAASLIYANVDARLTFRLGCEEKAESMVDAAMGRMIGRYERAENVRKRRKRGRRKESQECHQ